MRCLALAAVLRQRGFRSVFVCRSHEGNVSDAVEESGHMVVRLAVSDSHVRGDGQLVTQSPLGAAWHIDAEETTAVIASLGERVAWLVVDHYAIAEQWELALRPFVARIMVIDDLGNRAHDCDILLDQNLHADSVALYRPLIASDTITFFGPKYAILRAEFDDVGLVRRRDGSVHRILVFFGGVDVGNQAARVLRALEMLGNASPEATLVLGATNPHRRSVRDAARQIPYVTARVATDRMAQLIAAADIGIGTCGISAWERCALALPSLVTVSADNQRDDAKMLHARGACWNLGEAPAVTALDWREAITKLCTDPARVAEMSSESLSVMAGRHDANATLIEAIVSDR